MKFRLAYIIFVHVLLVAAVVLLALRWAPDRGSRRVSFVTKRGAETDLASQVEGPAEDWLDGQLFHSVLIDDQPVIEITESADGVASIGISPEFATHRWLFTYGHEMLGLAMQEGVTISPRNVHDEIMDPELGRARAYTYVDQDADGMPDLRMTLRLPIDPNARAVRWQLVEQPWQVWPWPDAETGDGGPE